jgi:hypothetical protein
MCVQAWVAALQQTLDAIRDDFHDETLDKIHEVRWQHDFCGTVVVPIAMPSEGLFQRTNSLPGSQPTGECHLPPPI